MVTSLTAIAGAVAVALAIWLTGGDGRTTQATGPTPPPDCYVADEPTAGGPPAPSQLQARDQLDLRVHVSWADNSDDETCFVLEASVSDYLPLEYEIVAFLPPGTTFYSDGPYPEGETIHYKIYASTSSARSVYSNEAHTNIPFYEPTFTPSPPSSLTPTATPTQIPTASPSTNGTMSPTPSPTSTVGGGTPSPTPAQLPEAGGPQRGGSASAAAIGFSLLALAGAFLLAGAVKRRRDGATAPPPGPGPMPTPPSDDPAEIADWLQNEFPE